MWLRLAWCAVMLVAAGCRGAACQTDDECWAGACEYGRCGSTLECLPDGCYALSERACRDTDGCRFELTRGCQGTPTICEDLDRDACLREPACTLNPQAYAY